MKVVKFWSLFAVFLLVVLYAWIHTYSLGPFGLRYLRHTSSLFAVFGVIFIFMQFVLSSRLKTLEVGFGLDKMLNYHRYFGRSGLTLVFLHFILIILYQWLESGRISFGFPAWLGLIALAAFTVTAVLAATYKKLRIAYEVWKNIHLLNYIVFPVALVHFFLNLRQDSLLYYLWLILVASFAVIIFYRLACIYRIRKNPLTVIEVKQEAIDIWSLHLSGSPFPYKPGQFLMIQLLRSGKLSYSHPFTISSSPTQEHISITPKELGDFTSTIKNTREGDLAFIDAPYGVFSFLNYDSDELVFIAGGIGITPFMSMLRYIFDKQLQKKVTLFWANKNEDNLCFRNELAEMQQEMPDFKAILVMSGQKDWPGEQGRVNAKLIQKYLADLPGKDFFVCGPPAMIRAVQGELLALHVPRHRIHFEVFEL